MNKIILCCLTILFNYGAFSQESGNYIVIINNDSVYVDLEKEVRYQPSSGKEMSIKVIQPNILDYSDELVSFKYSKVFTVSNTKVDEGIEQCMVMNSTGNGFIVQKYFNMDPSSLTQLMVSELTKESVSYGYKKKEKSFKKKLKSGQTIKGVEATLSYKGEEEVYMVSTYGGKDFGVIVITMMLNDDFKEDQQIIDLFLETLSIKE